MRRNCLPLRPELDAGAKKATKGQMSIIQVDNLSTALFLVSMGNGICIAL